MHLLFFPRRCAIMARFGAMAIGGAGVGAILPTAGLNPKLQRHKPSQTCKLLSPEVDMDHFPKQTTKRVSIQAFQQFTSGSSIHVSGQFSPFMPAKSLLCVQAKGASDCSP